MARRYRFVERIFVFIAILALMTPIVDGQTIIGPPANLFLDPKDDPYNPLRYITSNTLTAIAFALVMLVALVQTFYMFRYGAKWMLAMVIGGYTYSVGFGCRFGLHYHPDSEGLYIVEYMFIVLSPCMFIAADYVLLGRLARHISCPTHVLLPVQKLTFVFMSSDVTTALIQATGGGLSISHNQAPRQWGSHIFLAGLVLQLVSFTLFSGIYVRFLYRVYTLERGVWERDKAEPWYRDWRTLAVTLAISCIGILTRSGYRVAELSQGFQGYLATTEGFFYALDTLPLVIATSVYVFSWPGWFIKDGTKTVHVEPELSNSP
ncbi:RTA1-domain-containing protein [Boletus edulis]|uniref:RTA1-domain-containing protein n=1 Tax=Boletus edulis BED1 TaxID=1328754 RepID=A0AAD4C600_BOLED|nr:RTA1-domain-containing protein [Boletus edulis]KAF8450289.1 RTA1-domain-containing protein [Boletus edulis BED1]